MVETMDKLATGLLTLSVGISLMIGFASLIAFLVGFVLAVIGSKILAKWLNETIAKPLREMNEKKNSHHIKGLRTSKQSE